MTFSPQMQLGLIVMTFPQGEDGARVGDGSNCCCCVTSCDDEPRSFIHSWRIRNPVTGFIYDEGGIITEFGNPGSGYDLLFTEYPNGFWIPRLYPYAGVNRVRLEVLCECNIDPNVFPGPDSSWFLLEEWESNIVLCNGEDARYPIHEFNHPWNQDIPCGETNSCVPLPCCFVGTYQYEEPDIVRATIFRGAYDNEWSNLANWEAEDEFNRPPNRLPNENSEITIYGRLLSNSLDETPVVKSVTVSGTNGGENRGVLGIPIVATDFGRIEEEGSIVALADCEVAGELTTPLATLHDSADCEGIIRGKDGEGFLVQFNGESRLLAAGTVDRGDSTSSRVEFHDDSRAGGTSFVTAETIEFSGDAQAIGSSRFSGDELTFTDDSRVSGTVNYCDVAAIYFRERAVNDNGAQLCDSVQAYFYDDSQNTGSIYGNSGYIEFNDSAINSGTARVNSGEVYFNAGTKNTGTVEGDAPDVYFVDARNEAVVIAPMTAFRGASVNASTGAVTGDAEFYDESVNEGTVTGDVSFYGESRNASVGSVLSNAGFYDDSVNEGNVQGNALFYGSSINEETGSVDGSAEFIETSANKGSVADAGIFRDSSLNDTSGSVGENAEFFDTSANRGSVALGAIFRGTSENDTGGSVAGDAEFVDDSSNKATVGGNAVFRGNSQNGTGGSVGGSSSFFDDAVNNSTVDGNGAFSGNAENSNSGSVAGGATFIDNATNRGTVGGFGTFRNDAVNDTTGSIDDNAQFFDDSINRGSVSGTATFTGGCNDGGTAGTFAPDPPPEC